MSVLTLQDVHKSYPSRTAAALDGVELQLAAGEILAVLGASGSGKTTLLNLAAGLDRPDRGSISLLGRPLEDMNESQLAALRRRHLGLVFQTLNLVPTLTAAENVELPLALAGVPAAQRRSRVAELLARAGLPDRGTSWPDELSIGQQQRIAVLRAIAHQPDLVLMDEPTSALDSHTAEAVMELVLDLARSQNVAVLVATHDTRVAEMLPRAAHLLDGRLAETAESAS